MLYQQTSSREVEPFPRREEFRAGDSGYVFEASFYIDLLKRRFFAFAIPFVLTLAVGGSIVAIRPAIYLVEGKILVESPQIPSELVRSTVPAFANERIQLLEQRIMTRDNLLAIATKFEVFAHGQDTPSIVALMRLRTQIKPSEVKIPTRPNERQAIVFTVGFEHEKPAVALRVTNELITTILNEEARTRTAVASETTRFLARETTKVETELSAIEVQIAEIKRRRVDLAMHVVQPGESQLAALKAELAQKASLYSDAHPDTKVLKQKIAALERTIVPTKTNDFDLSGIDALERQQSSLQKILETANQKLTAARIGESMERGQQSERLEVIEQPTLPNAPVRPNRPKLLLTVLAISLAAGVAFAFFIEKRDDTIRRISDLSLFAENGLMGIPFIETKTEVRSRRLRTALLCALTFTCIVAGSVAVAILLPIEQLLADAIAAIKLI
jgi:uncharacterized protein involved in exopolysaccharide biosynthesis